MASGRMGRFNMAVMVAVMLTVAGVALQECEALLDGALVNLKVINLGTQTVTIEITTAGVVLGEVEAGGIETFKRVPCVGIMSVVRQDGMEAHVPCTLPPGHARRRLSQFDQVIDDDLYLNVEVGTADVGVTSSAASRAFASSGFVRP